MYVLDINIYIELLVVDIFFRSDLMSFIVKLINIFIVMFIKEKLMKKKVCYDYVFY